MALLESGVDFEYHHVDMKSNGHKSPEFLKRQPFGKVPAFAQGDFTLFESRAIMRHVAAKFAPGLVPAVAEDAAIMEQAISVEYSYFYPAFMPIYRERMLKADKGLLPDEAAAEAAITELGPVLDVMDRLLASKEYFAGGSFSLADLTFMPYIHCFDRLRIGTMLAERPNLAAWWAHVAARPTWVYVTSGAVVEKAPE